MTQRKYEEFQSDLHRFNRRRTTPSYFHEDWRSRLEQEITYRRFEGDLIQEALDEVQPLLAELPSDPAGFGGWIEDLKSNGPGQQDAILPWIAELATPIQLQWFIAQEAFAEEMMSDCVAYTSVGMPKWLNLDRIRVPLFALLAREFGVIGTVPILPECLAQSNLLIGIAANRHFAFHSLGALSIHEATTHVRIVALAKALGRMNIQCILPKPTGWIQDALLPLIEEAPELMRPIAEGALMRMKAGERCFARYRAKLWGNDDPLNLLRNLRDGLSPGNP